jgi:hypothetical protein
MSQLRLALGTYISRQLPGVKHNTGLILRIASFGKDGTMERDEAKNRASVPCNGFVVSSTNLHVLDVVS